MKIIGITGGIGSGKSDVLRYLKEKGAFILEADSLAHRLMLPGKEAYSEILKHFGRDILMDDGTIDREKMGSLVFRDEKALETLNSIVHPAVKRYICRDIEEKKKELQYHLYVIEAALLIQDGYRNICDEMWYISVNREERIKRLVSGRGGEASKYEKVMKNQEPDSFYIENCDVVIDNNGTFEDTKNIIDKLLIYKQQ